MKYVTVALQYWKVASEYWPYAAFGALMGVSLAVALH